MNNSRVCLLHVLICWTFLFCIGFSPITYAAGVDGYTVLMLHGDGSGSSFTDSSQRNHAITASGATQSTTKSLFGGSSISFDGSSSLEIADNDDFDFGTGDFTIDAWFMLNVDTNSHTIIEKGEYSIGNGNFALAIYGASDVIYFRTYDVQGNAEILSVSASIEADTWYHVAVVRLGNTITIYLDGVSKGSATVLKAVGGNTATLEIGDATVGGFLHFDGYIDELRISKGIARWTNNFTPPYGAYSYGGSNDDFLTVLCYQLAYDHPTETMPALCSGHLPE